MEGGIRLAADIGGTFTDVAVVDSAGRLATFKLPTTSHDFAEAVVAGAEALTAGIGATMTDAEAFLHATTVATNAILEHRGARTALVTTAGFRDVLELRRIRTPHLYDPLYVKPPPLVPRDLRLEVAERMAPDGTVRRPLDLENLARVAAALAAEGVEAVAVCLLHAYANPAHEEAVGAALAEALPDAFIALSHRVLPEMLEYERTSTTVVNAYLGPVVGIYLRRLSERLGRAGLTRPLLVMQSSGGVGNVPQVLAKPGLIAEGGPAAGVTGARVFAAANGWKDVITFDMGGTTAKASLVEDGAAAVAEQYEVGSHISHTSALTGGGGYTLRMPAVDIAEIGAGGGSIVRLDQAGAVRVGPESTGARPGPACYGLGGTRPTITDANLVLGYLNPRSLAAGRLPIDRDLGARAVAEHVAGPLGRGLEETAYGIHAVANAQMIRAIKSVSTQRGRDPSRFVLMAFGGCGGMHAPGIAQALRIPTIVVPPAAGVFSALGLLMAALEATASAAFLRPAAEAGAAELTQRFDRLAREAAGTMDLPPAALEIARHAQIRYVDQAFEVRVDVPEGAGPDAIVEAFETEHSRKYGHNFAGRSTVEFVALGVTARLREARPPLIFARPDGPAATGERQAYFGPAHGQLATPVIDRFALDEAPRQGPLIVEEAEGTTVVPPDCSARLDGAGSIVITVGEGAR